eukprot:993168_1
MATELKKSEKGQGSGSSKVYIIQHRKASLQEGSSTLSKGDYKTLVRLLKDKKCLFGSIFQADCGARTLDIIKRNYKLAPVSDTNRTYQELIRVTANEYDDEQKFNEWEKSSHAVNYFKLIDEFCLPKDPNNPQYVEAIQAIAPNKEDEIEEDKPWTDDMNNSLSLSLDAFCHQQDAFDSDAVMADTSNAKTPVNVPSDVSSVSSNTNPMSLSDKTPAYVPGDAKHTINRICQAITSNAKTHENVPDKPSTTTESAKEEAVFNEMETDVFGDKVLDPMDEYVELDVNLLNKLKNYIGVDNTQHLRAQRRVICDTFQLLNPSEYSANLKNFHDCVSSTVASLVLQRNNQDKRVKFANNILADAFLLQSSTSDLLTDFEYLFPADGGKQSNHNKAPTHSTEVLLNTMDEIAISSLITDGTIDKNATVLKPFISLMPGRKIVNLSRKRHVSFGSSKRRFKRRKLKHVRVPNLRASEPPPANDSTPITWPSLSTHPSLNPPNQPPVTAAQFQDFQADILRKIETNTTNSRYSTNSRTLLRSDMDPFMKLQSINAYKLASMVVDVSEEKEVMVKWVDASVSIKKSSNDLALQVIRRAANGGYTGLSNAEIAKKLQDKKVDKRKQAIENMMCVIWGSIDVHSFDFYGWMAQTVKLCSRRYVSFDSSTKENQLKSFFKSKDNASHLFVCLKNHLDRQIASFAASWSNDGCRAQNIATQFAALKAQDFQHSLLTFQRLAMDTTISAHCFWAIIKNVWIEAILTDQPLFTCAVNQQLIANAKHACSIMYKTLDDWICSNFDGLNEKKVELEIKGLSDLVATVQRANNQQHRPYYPPHNSRGYRGDSYRGRGRGRGGQHRGGPGRGRGGHSRGPPRVSKLAFAKKTANAIANLVGSSFDRNESKCAFYQLNQCRHSDEANCVRNHKCVVDGLDHPLVNCPALSAFKDQIAKLIKQ